MREHFIFLTVGLLSSSFAAIPAWADPAAIPKDSDLGRLQGHWTARAGPRREILVTLHVHGHHVDAAFTTPRGLKIKVRGEVKLDDSTAPRRIDWIKFTSADQQEFPPIAGIYKLDQNRFTVCTGGLNGPRPSEFKAGDGVLTEVVVFERDPIPSPNQHKPSPKSQVANN
jgi:uncharacterized protein (TIGR03067 family)